jgi:citrate lyase beta subunit
MVRLGSHSRALEKAKTIPADSLILDLEDAVAPNAKDAARDLVVNALRAGGFNKKEVGPALTINLVQGSPGLRYQALRLIYPRIPEKA